MQPIWFLDTLVRVHLDGEATGGAYSLVECVAPSGHMPPPHVHAVDSEGFHVLEGELTLHTEAGPHVLRAGDSLYAPSGAPHTLQVTGDAPCRWLVVSAPAAFDAFVRAYGTPAERDELPRPAGPPDLERLTEVAGAHGITFVGPPGTTPAQPAAGGAVA